MTRKADELVFLDITASAEGVSIIYDVVRRTAEQVLSRLPSVEVCGPSMISATC